jgi:hypothetical protein
VDGLDCDNEPAMNPTAATITIRTKTLDLLMNASKETTAPRAGTEPIERSAPAAGSSHRAQVGKAVGRQGTQL